MKRIDNSHCGFGLEACRCSARHRRFFSVSKARPRDSQSGVLLVEILLAVGVFGLITLIVLSAFTYGRESTAIAGDNSRAAQVANSTVEALQNIAQSSYANLNNYNNGTTYYLNTSGNQWGVTTTPTTLNGIYTPSFVFSNGPNNSRQVTITVDWKANAQRQGKITSTTYLSNWQTGSNATIKTGLLVYANGGTTTSLINYRLLQPNGLWTTPLALPSVGASNRVARSVKLYSAQTGNAKVVIARFFNGSTQYIYGFPWNGSSWGTPQLLDNWNSSAALDSGNFSGTYLANGTFMAVYSDNTNRPKFNTYTGGVWSAQGQFNTISNNSSDTPTSMIVHARPGTNEAMVAMLGENYDTMTSYYNNGSWTPFTVHATNGTTNGTHNVDFDWSAANGANQGALVFTRGSSDRTPSVQIFTADGSGSGTWGNTMTGSNQPAGSIVTSLAVAGQLSGSAKFMVCDKDSATVQKIYCYTADQNGVTTPTNPILANATAAGGAQTMELGFEDQIGTIGLSAYSDDTTSGKLKRFTSSTNTWDASPLAAPVAANDIAKTRIIPEPGLNDAMVLQIDSRNNLYTIMYKGDGHVFYTTPTGYSWTIHNANGPSVGAKWFDFGWDN
ncbi:MAG: type II secretion system protein [Candidatus Saccharimonadales bacterium]